MPATHAAAPSSALDALSCRPAHALPGAGSPGGHAKEPHGAAAPRRPAALSAAAGSPNARPLYQNKTLLASPRPFHFPWPAGVLALGVSVRASVLRRTEFGGSQATEASVRRLELELPTLSRPLTLRADGVSLALQQVKLPMVRACAPGLLLLQCCTAGPGHAAARDVLPSAAACPELLPPLSAADALQPRSPGARADAEAAARAADKAARLAVVESLLWGLPQQQKQQAQPWWNPSGERRQPARCCRLGLGYRAAPGACAWLLPSVAGSAALLRNPLRRLRGTPPTRTQAAC